MKISELYGKTIAGANGRRKGYIMGVSFRKNAVEGLICCDENERTFYVAGEDITALCGETRFIKTGKAQKNAASLKLGKAAYTSGGKFAGYMEDCVLSGLRITYAVIGGKKVPFANLTLGDIVILNDGKQRAELAAKDMFISAVCADN